MNNKKQIYYFSWQVWKKQIINIIDILGSFKVHMEGFKTMHLKIERSGDINDLPVAHTCFYTIDLPPYSDKSTLQKKLKFYFILLPLILIH